MIEEILDKFCKVINLFNSGSFSNRFASAVEEEEWWRAIELADKLLKEFEFPRIETSNLDKMKILLFILDINKIKKTLFKLNNKYFW